MDRYIFKNAKHSVQNNIFFTFKVDIIISTINNSNGIIYIPVTMFHIKDIIPVTLAAIICAILSVPKYLGFNPTIPNATADKNGRN